MIGRDIALTERHQERKKSSDKTKNTRVKVHPIVWKSRAKSALS